MRGYARFVNAAVEAAKARRPGFALTPTELAILRALPEGRTLEAIAADFQKSRKTIERHVGSIYQKLEVSNRAQAIRRARELGIFA
jgi:LuxR family maltose regulon positive regulatory protein